MAASTSDLDAAPTMWFARLTHLGVIECMGADVRTFLHAQLTHDVLAQPSTRLDPTGYCTPKGRLIATMWQFVSADATGEPLVRLVVARDLAATVAKRLSMYVLRAKVRVRDASDAYVVLGAVGNLVAPTLPAPRTAALAPRDGAVAEGRVDDVDATPRTLLVVSVASVDSVAQALRDAGAHERDAAAWRLDELRAGMPHVVAATTEAFVPQMINFELVGGVNFRKGCYPGQEVVARSQYLGKLKRRMFRGVVVAERAPSPGADVLDATSAPVGVVVNAEPGQPGQIELLFETTWAAADGLLQVDSVVIERAALPYDVPRESNAA